MPLYHKLLIVNGLVPMCCVSISEACLPVSHFSFAVRHLRDAVAAFAWCLCCLWYNSKTPLYRLCSDACISDWTHAACYSILLRWAAASPWLSVQSLRWGTGTLESCIEPCVWHCRLILVTWQMLSTTTQEVSLHTAQDSSLAALHSIHLFPLCKPFISSHTAQPASTKVKAA